MQSIGVLLKDGGRKAAYGHLLPQVEKEESDIHTVNRTPSFPVIVSARTAPGVSPLMATGIKCSVRPWVALSIRTSRAAPHSDASRRCNAASPVARNRLARSLITSPATCGIRAAG